MSSKSDQNMLELLRRTVPSAVRQEHAYKKNDMGKNPIVARLDANEAPYPISRASWQRALRSLERQSVQRYPHLDEVTRDLGVRLSELWLGQPAGPSRTLMFGVGSDELITLLLATFCARETRPPSILVPTPTFSMYALSARLRGFRVHEVPLTETFSLDVARIKRVIAAKRPNIVFLASPNNPTGNAFRTSDLQEIARATEQASSLLVIDEAYGYYSSSGSMFRALRAPHVIFMSTLSKIGMAGLRLGFISIEKTLALEVEKLRLPYNVPTPTAVLALALLQDENLELSRNVERVRKGRIELARIAESHGLLAMPSDSNIVLMKTPYAGIDCANALRDGGVLVRAFSAPRLSQHIRVNVGTPREHRALDAALASIKLGDTTRKSERQSRKPR